MSDLYERLKTLDPALLRNVGQFAGHTDDLFDAYAELAGDQAYRDVLAQERWFLEVDDEGTCVEGSVLLGLSLHLRREVNFTM